MTSYHQLGSMPALAAFDEAVWDDDTFNEESTLMSFGGYPGVQQAPVINEANPARKGYRRGNKRAVLTKEQKEAKLEHRRAKNREMQARFRERRRAEQNVLEHRYESAHAELDLLIREVHQQTHMEKALTQCIELKESAISILNCNSPPLLKNISGPATSASSNEDIPSTPRPHYNPMVAMAQEPEPELEQMIDKIKVTYRDQLGGTLTAPPPSQLQAMVDVLQKQTPEEFMRRYIDINERLRCLIAAYEMEKRPEVLKLIKISMNDRIVWLTLTLKHRPDLAKRLLATVQIPGEDDLSADSRWRGIAERLELTPDQRKDLAALWKAFLKATQIIQSQGGAALRRLQGYQEEIRSTSCLQNIVDAYLTLVDSTRSLELYTEREFLANLELINTVNMVINILQKAQLAVFAGPRLPDFIRLVKVIAEDEHVIEN